MKNELRPLGRAIVRGPCTPKVSSNATTKTRICACTRVKDRYESRRSATKLISPRRSAAPNDVARPIYDEVPQAIFICKKAVFFQRKELHWSPPSRLNRRLSRERAHDKHSEKTWRSCSGCNRMRTNARSVGRVERRQSSPGRAPGGNLLLQVFLGSSWCVVP